ncbi:MAG: aminopeptidase P family protein [Betaproteobacteria bacterium]|nr:aminopeptidase P family protein [Betaproteobacteria bacterium]
MSQSLPLHPVFDDPKIQAILAQEYGRMSDGEFARRKQLLAGAMAKHSCDAVLLCGEQRVGNGVYWITGWPVLTEGTVVFQPERQETLFVEHYNHLPNARRMALGVEVRWAERKGAACPIAELKHRGAKRVGLIGALSWGKIRALGEAFDLVDLNGDYAQIRMRKSDEEMDWMRLGAALSDLGIEALANGAKPGMNERELGALVDNAYQPLGGATTIHFIGINEMANPDLCVPPQWHSTRKLKRGDMMFVEFTASFWDYSGQVLRSFTVDAEPTPLFRDLYNTAEAAFYAITGVLRAGVHAQEIVDASRVIEAAGFTTYDDILHGFGGGYWAPVLGSMSRPSGPVPDMKLEADMTVVVQPNVITSDQKAGVQLGEMVRITATGFERMHHAPWGFRRIGAS